MTEIRDAFSRGKAFVAFVTCGDPDLETTAEVIRALVGNGVSLIELGIPFSDPTAEGPVIQAANERALKAGTTTDRIFDMVAEVRRDVTVPMVFMTYANVVFSYGTERFLDRCVELDIQGIILPDVPFEEKADFDPQCRERGLALVSMVAPTSESRISMIASEAYGFVYVVSSLGVTGVRSSITTDIGSMTSLIRKSTDVPCAVGFGISTPEQARTMAEHADGIIIGSAIVRLVGQYGRDAPAHVGDYARSIREALDGM